NTDRMNVWSALNEVAPSTWGDRPMRTDYPLNQIDKPLKWSTGLIYLAIRSISIITLILGLVSAIVMTVRSSHEGELAGGCLAVALAVGWCIAHSIPAGMLVFPEFRYTYANLLVLMSGAAAWLAHLPALLRRSRTNDNMGSTRKYFSMAYRRRADRGREAE